jgi:hypothetical protein
MGVPDHPVTREEQFLDAIRSGSTSNLPTPVTRTEEYLNAIANNGGGGGGSGGGVLVVHEDAETHALDKTWQEIYDAGFSVLFSYYSEEGGTETAVSYITMYYTSDSLYGVGYANVQGGSNVYMCDTANGYPVLQ